MFSICLQFSVWYKFYIRWNVHKSVHLLNFDQYMHVCHQNPYEDIEYFQHLRRFFRIVLSQSPPTSAAPETGRFIHLWWGCINEIVQPLWEKLWQYLMKGNRHLLYDVEGPAQERLQLPAHWTQAGQSPGVHPQETGQTVTTETLEARVTDGLLREAGKWGVQISYRKHRMSMLTVLYECAQEDLYVFQIKEIMLTQCRY